MPISRSKVPTIAIVKFTPNNGNSESQFANELYYPPGTSDQQIRRTFYNDEFPQSQYNEQTRESTTRFYRPRYPSNPYNEYSSLNEENYDDRESKLRKKPLTFDEIDDRLYRTRRQPYNLRDYNDDAIESIKNALDQEAKSKFTDDKDPNTINTVPVNELEFLINEKPPNNYFDKKQTEDNPDVEYEKALLEKYEHPRKFIELLNKEEYLLDNVKSGSKSDDYDNDNYDDLIPEIELPERDTSSMENAMYTEGGLVNDKSNTETDGKV